MKKIFFPSKYGRVCGILRDFGDSSILIYTHGKGSTKDDTALNNLLPFFDKNRISTLNIDMYGHGESQGKYPNLTVTKAAESIKAAARYAKKRGFRKIGAMAGSLGGWAAIIAALEGNISPLILGCPVTNMRYQPKYNKKALQEWKKRGYTIEKEKNGVQKLKYSYCLDGLKNDAYKVAHKLGMSILILHGDKDVNVPLKGSIEFAKKACDCRLIVLKGVGHFDVFKEPKRIEKDIKEFLKANGFLEKYK